METHTRTILKACTWRLIALFITTAVVFTMTGKLAFAASIGAIDTAIKIGAYYLHERAWLKTKFGIRRGAEFEI